MGKSHLRFSSKVNNRKQTQHFRHCERIRKDSRGNLQKKEIDCHAHFVRSQ
ncbi:hypothetical protein [Helicobacter sp. MIT 01-3238]|uniref:hypothetical protein n=1 Tax=Helicobacter sp. MIT 01-3238 TaxID=398627 RepID=UPI0015F13A6C|nr:hypothetical protein [Helicobacter sp. MIT 01-3238]